MHWSGRALHFGVVTISVRVNADDTDDVVRIEMSLSLASDARNLARGDIEGRLSRARKEKNGIPIVCPGWVVGWWGRAPAVGVYRPGDVSPNAMGPMP
jgi:hypothetical protein